MDCIAFSSTSACNLAQTKAIACKASSGSTDCVLPTCTSLSNQNGTFTSSRCLPSTTAANTTALVSSLSQMTKSTASKVAILGFASGSDCGQEPISASLHTLNTCGPSPFADNSYGIVYTDLTGASLFFDAASDALCKTLKPQTRGLSLGAASSSPACANDLKISTQLLSFNGFASVAYNSQAKGCLDPPGRLTLAASNTPCSPIKECQASRPLTHLCHANASAYDIVGEAQRLFKNKPYILLETYPDTNCTASSTPQSKDAVLLDLCHSTGDLTGSFRYIQQPGNGSIVYSKFNQLNCTGSVSSHRTFDAGVGQCVSRVKLAGLGNAMPMKASNRAPSSSQSGGLSKHSSSIVFLFSLLSFFV
ncbi:hypothetical protein BDR26DRAFT_853162 [Obelidium mucronatum]|nr:hypothetical protein BDR26DRAFT_853162 [Obelidium mucronatum]